MKLQDLQDFVAERANALTILVAGIALVGCAWMSSLFPTVPITLEDFSALLAADTIATGRLANPPHSYWPHFDKGFVLQQPNYVSTFSPLPGAALALGQLLGEPLYGVALSFALACAALFWMLRAWPGVGATWALIGALLTALHPQILAYWGIGYTGGAMGLLGGALLYGALFRLTRAPVLRDGLILGAGAGILIVTRPYEGIIACIPAAAVLLYALVRGPGQPTSTDEPALRRVLLRGGAVLSMALLFQGFYNFRTTGEVLTSPRQAYDRAYASVPDFLFQEREPKKTYNTVSLERLYGDGGRQAAPYLSRQSPESFASGIAAKALLYQRFFSSTGLAVLLFAIPFVWKDVRFAVIAWLLFGAALSIETFEAAHFAAPFTALGIGIAMATLRYLWSLRIGRVPIGALLAVVAVAVTFAEQLEAVDDRGSEREMRPLNERELLAGLVEQASGKHLVLLHYGIGHGVRWEWAINHADIDNSKVVWALELELDRTKDLVNYFSDRTIWRLKSARSGIEIRPFPVGETWKTAKVEVPD